MDVKIFENANCISEEAEWLYKSQYSFMISDKLWPYGD